MDETKQDITEKYARYLPQDVATLLNDDSVIIWPVTVCIRETIPEGSFTADSMEELEQIMRMPDICNGRITQMIKDEKGICIDVVSRNK